MKQRHRILIACMPKSGSTYLATILANLPQFAVTSWVPDFDRREQELCLERLRSDEVAYPNWNLVAQHHVRYSNATKSCIEQFELSPLVLVRNIYDVIPSLIDHHRTESVVYPMAYVPPAIVDWDFDRAARFISYMVLPWYFNFFVSWSHCQEKSLLTYEGLIADPTRAVREICNKLKIEVSNSEIGSAVQRTQSIQTRKNVGIPGRGNDLPEECINHIKEMLSFYGGYDFSSIGL